MIILGIESSCDDTSISIIDETFSVKSLVISSQTKIHKKYGGVVPELASRMHTEAIHFLLEKALEEASITFQDIDLIAVTYGPGLEGALIVGLTVAKTLATILNKPLIGVNHLHGHLYSPFLTQKPEFPYIGLIVSGGHTTLAKVEAGHRISLLSQTRDDAAGEAFDKVARLMGLPYPGGPVVEEHAKTGSETAFRFPRAMKNQGLEFSFSGLKTAVAQAVKTFTPDAIPIDDICASFQKAVCDSLCDKSRLACEQEGILRLVVCGGVAANQSLIASLQTMADLHGITLYSVPPKFCTDNAAMIAASALIQFQSGQPIRSTFPMTSPGLPLCS